MLCLSFLQEEENLHIKTIANMAFMTRTGGPHHATYTPGYYAGLAAGWLAGWLALVECMRTCQEGACRCR